MFDACGCGTACLRDLLGDLVGKPPERWPEGGPAGGDAYITAGLEARDPEELVCKLKSAPCLGLPLRIPPTKAEPPTRESGEAGGGWDESPARTWDTSACCNFSLGGRPARAQRSPTGSSHRSETAPPPKSRPPRASPGSPSYSAGSPSSAVGGEAWPAFLERAAQRTAAALPDGQTPIGLFEAFRTTDDLGLVFASFAQLFALATQVHESGSLRDKAGGLDAAATRDRYEPPWAGPPEGCGQPPWQFPYEPIRVLLSGHWRAKQLWEKLDKRVGRPEYAEAPCATGRMSGLSAVVVGAGPCGLRMAIELRLLGARVAVVERRRDFSRINQLHIWPWCGEEIKALGARCLEPPAQDFGANPDKLNISINELQVMLLKTALLLGVQVLLGTDFLGATCQDGIRCVRLGPATRNAHGNPDGRAPDGGPTEEPSVKAPSLLQHVGVVICSDGSSCSAGRSLGMSVAEIGCLRAEDAIGLVCNFKPLPTAEERTLRSFSLARQFFGPLFRELADATGAELENIVYTKSKLSHYFVMTPTRSCLISKGIVRDASRKPLLAADNIDHASLDALVRGVAAFPLKAGAKEPTLAEVAARAGCELSYADGGPQLFDFSKLRRADRGLAFVDLTPGGDGEDHAAAAADKALLVALVGDALLEPFWPEGLGIIRGFFSVFDASSAISLWAGGASREAVEQHFAEAFAQLKSLGIGSKGTLLCPEEASYGLAPRTRYRALRCGGGV